MGGWTQVVSVAMVVGGLAVGIGPAAAQERAGGQVVVRAVTGDGTPVMGLIDGRERAIASLELVRPAGGAAPAGTGAPAVASPMLPAPYATNAVPAAGAGGGREFLIAIDDDGIAPGRDSLVRGAVENLMTHLSPSDAIGIVSLRRGGPRLAPTRDRAASNDALRKIVASGAVTESINDFGCRTKAVLSGLASLFEGAPANRTILLFSSGVTPPTGEQIRESLGKQKDADEAVCQVMQRDLDAVGRSAASSPAAIYVIFIPEAVANNAYLRTGESGLENVAGVTGGDMIRMVGAAPDAMTRIAETAGIYYLAGFAEALPADIRRIDARVAREGVKVVARPAGAAATTVTATAKAASPRDMIRTATVFRDLAIRAAGFASRQANATELMVLAVFEPEDPAVKLTAATVGLFDGKGTLRAQWTAEPGELQQAPVKGALAVPPGKYRMRVAATDAAGRGGTTDYDLLVELPDAPPVKTSHMLLGVSQGGFAPKLTFTSADATAIGFIELYGVAKDAKVEASFEIVKASGEVLGTGGGTVGAGKGDDARIAYGGFGIATLEPGDYTMRAIITVDGKQAGVVTRTLRKGK
jgi:hypothetical protein